MLAEKRIRCHTREDAARRPVAKRLKRERKGRDLFSRLDRITATRIYRKVAVEGRWLRRLSHTRRPSRTDKETPRGRPDERLPSRPSREQQLHKNRQENHKRKEKQRKAPKTEQLQKFTRQKKGGSYKVYSPNIKQLQEFTRGILERGRGRGKV